MDIFRSGFWPGQCSRLDRFLPIKGYSLETTQKRPASGPLQARFQHTTRPSSDQFPHDAAVNEPLLSLAAGVLPEFPPDVIVAAARAGAVLEHTRRFLALL
jgi:hypothetical protein